MFHVEHRHFVIPSSARNLLLGTAQLLTEEFPRNVVAKAFCLHTKTQAGMFHVEHHRFVIPSSARNLLFGTTTTP